MLHSSYCGWFVAGRNRELDGRGLLIQFQGLRFCVALLLLACNLRLTFIENTRTIRTSSRIECQEEQLVCGGRRDSFFKY